MKDQIRASEIFPQTFRSSPSDASTPGHQLLIKAGFIRQLASGVFFLEPFAMRVLWKIEKIVREEMNRINGLEVHLPILQPKEYWEQTERWDLYRRKGIMFSTTDRRQQIYGLSPTAEELATLLARMDISSYQQLPLNLWQMDWKFRDEVRPRLGLLRCKYFRMKDAYTFDIDAEGMRRSYEQHRQAYAKMFERMGFDFISVKADSGPIGGQGSAEFMALSSYGEDVLLTCAICDYGANLESAESLFSQPEYSQNLKSSHKEATPNIRTVEELQDFFHLTPQQMVKTIIYVAGEESVAVCCRGDLLINETKLGNLLKATSLEIASDSVVVEVSGAPVGFAGPIGLKQKVRIIYDTSIAPMTNFLCGCNEEDFHMLDVNFGQDIPFPEAFYDVHTAVAGDTCVACRQGVLQESRGIEVGHIFMLQQNYAQKMGLTFLDKNGQAKTPWMGCYGVGTTRCLQALVEQYHDDEGIKWPGVVAPYHYVIVPSDWREGSDQHNLAEEIFSFLARSSKEVVLDDRSLSFGAKMKDALLIGYPFIVVVGRGAAASEIELQVRSSGQKSKLSVAGFLKEYA